MDRGFVFRLINLYMDIFAPSDSRALHDFKFTFLQIICSHEHYVSFNLPMMQSRVKGDYNVCPLISESFSCKTFHALSEDNENEEQVDEEGMFIT